MDVGMPTLVEMKNIEEACLLARQLGFQFVELNMNLPYAGLEALKQTDLDALMKKYNLYFTVHADENLFFCDFNERVAKAHLDNMLDTIVLCKEYGIPLVNFHMSAGVYFRLPREKVYLFERFSDEYMNRLLHFRKKCEEMAGDQVKLCIENTGITLQTIRSGVDKLLESISFSLTWDVGHDYTAGLADSPFLALRNKRITHMHLHDAMGKNCHLPLGSGEMPLMDMLRSVMPERVVIEVKTVEGLKQSLPWLTENGLIK